MDLSKNEEKILKYWQKNKIFEKSLKKNDLCLARIVAVSFKGDDPKIGLTMRQPGLGKLDWIKDEKIKSKRATDKVLREKENKIKGKGKKKK